MLNAQNFHESEDVFTFSSEGDQVDRQFRIQRPSVDLEGEDTAYLINFIRPACRYKLFLAFRLAANQTVGDYDVAQNVIDVVVSYLNNPTNYQGYAVKMKTAKVEISIVEDHLEAEIDLEVRDDITLT